MITLHDGNLLESGCGIICHQVNVQGVMGGGLAAEIAEKYPDCEKAYGKYVRDFKVSDLLLSSVYWHKLTNGQYIANCFSQTAGFRTDLSAVKAVFENVRGTAETLGLSVGIPYKYGCGIASGKWEKVFAVIKEVFESSKVNCQIWRLKE